MPPSSFEIFSSVIFFLAILHTFFTPSVNTWALYLQKRANRLKKKWAPYHFASEILFLLSEIEIVFGLWLIPLVIGSILFFSWQKTLDHISSMDYHEPLYIVVIVLVVGAAPLISLAEKTLEKGARLGKDTPEAWWLTILICGPLLSVLLKESGAMALSCLLLARKFFPFRPSLRFRYATVGLLFASISIGGSLSTYSSRILYFLASRKGLTTSYFFREFGWKSLLAILVTTGAVFLLFRKEFVKFPKKLPTCEKDQETHAPWWTSFCHLVFLILVAFFGNEPILLVGAGLLFLAFYKVTEVYQKPLELRHALLAGFFFATLLIHGELQRWWVVKALAHLTEGTTLILSAILSAFVDNAIVIHITTDVLAYQDLKFYAAVAGSMAAGGLSVIANAPNPIGVAILGPFFQQKISPLRLFLGALFPTAVILSLFWILH